MNEAQRQRGYDYFWDQTETGTMSDHGLESGSPDAKAFVQGYREARTESKQMQQDLMDGSTEYSRIEPERKQATLPLAGVYEANGAY